MQFYIDDQPPLTAHFAPSLTLKQASKLVIGGDGGAFHLHGTVSSFECGLGYPDNMPRPLNLDEILR